MTATSDDVTVRDLLSANLLRLLRHYKIRKKTDFIRLPGIHSEAFLAELKERLEHMPFAAEVSFLNCPNTPASSFFRIKFSNRKLGGITVHLSHVAPVFAWRFEPVEGFEPIDWQKTRSDIVIQMRRYARARGQRLPKRIKALIERVLDVLAASGLIAVSEKELRSTPSRSRQIPKSLRNYSFAFFYFESIPIFVPTSKSRSG